MSLNRVTSLEAWEHHEAFLRLRRGQSDETIGPPDQGDDDSPRSQSLSASPSGLPRHSLAERLSFNPAAGPSWSQRNADGEWGLLEEESASLPGDGTDDDDESVSALARPIPRPETAFHESGPGLGGQSMGAFEVGKGKRIAQITVAVIYCFLAAGVVFGFAALKPILIQEGVFRGQCPGGEIGVEFEACYGQEIRLNLMFTIAAAATNIVALPVGAILDTNGPQVCSIIGSLLIAAGTLLFSFATHLPFDGYIPGYLLLSLGGPFIFISAFQLSNTFPARSGLILSMLTGAFDASSAVFLLFRIIHGKTNGTVSIQRFFWGYLIVPIFILLSQIFLMPATSYKTVGELVQQAEETIAEETNDGPEEEILDSAEREQRRKDRHLRREFMVSDIQNVLDDGTNDCRARTLNLDLNDPSAAQNNSTIQSITKLHKIRKSGGVWGAMHGASALEQIRSPWFILIALFTIIQMLRINYFVATIRQQYEYLLSSPTLSKQINQTFDILLPIGGLISIPFIGAILDSTTTTTVLITLVTFATLIGILGSIPNSMFAAYANITLFALYRPFYYTAVSDYAATVFGFRTFGKVYGLITCLAGVGNFMQAALDAITIKVFERNPIPVNIVLALDVFLVGAALIVFVWWRGRVWGRAWWKESRRCEEERVGERHTVDVSTTPVMERGPLLRSSSDPMNGGKYGSVDRS